MLRLATLFICIKKRLTLDIVSTLEAFITFFGQFTALCSQLGCLHSLCDGHWAKLTRTKIGGLRGLSGF